MDFNYMCFGFWLHLVMIHTCILLAWRYEWPQRHGKHNKKIYFLL